MKKNGLLIGGAALLSVAAVLMVNSANTNQSQPASSRVAATPVPEAHQHAATTAPAPALVIPAFLSVAPSKASLGPTLEPEQFTGVTRDAYRAVKQIPVTIAQLPCYCHCDRGFGHKSLYTCFEDDHASHCAVCVNEALLAIRLEREQKLKPAEIRAKIIEEYSR